MIFSDLGKMDRPPPEGSGCTTLGPGNVPVAGVIRKGICYSSSASKGGLIGLLGGAKQILPSGGTCPSGYRYVPAQPSRPCAGGARCMMPATEARCERDAILQVVDRAIPATPVSPGVPVGPLVPKDCPPGQYRPIGSAIGAPCVPVPASTPGVAPPLLGPPGSVRPSNLSADWRTGTCPTGYTFKPGANYKCPPTMSCSPSFPAGCIPPAEGPAIPAGIVTATAVAPPPPPQVAPQPVPPVTLPAPVPIPVQVQPGTAAAAAVDTINTAALMQAQLAQQQVQAAQAGMGPALGIGAGGLLLLALLMR